MTKLNILTVLFLFIVNISFSQKLELSTFLIPDNLKENANSVIRFENYSIEMESQRQMTMKLETAITIFNKLADNFADLTLNYDKRRVIKSVKGYVYDALGNEIKKIRKSDFKDYSASGSSLFSDSRVIHYDYTPTTYPYTIYYSYEIKTSNTAFIPGWILNGSYYQSIQKAKFSIKYPADIKLIKSEKNFGDYEIKKTEELGFLSYEVENIPALEREPYTPSLSDFLPMAKFGVNKFNLEGVDGEAENWEEFGKWYYYSLLRNTLDLPESTKQEILRLTKGVDDSIEKARIVYRYVQDKVRYISIQVGIGGFKPMLVSEVDKLSYGDCKALSNYTMSLLDAVGVESNYTIIYGGRNKRNIEKEFLSVQGNHVVLNIPTENGDLWLECTSQNTPFADGGDFTDDRDALVITPQGGIIKHTRIYEDKENHQQIMAKYTIDNDGNVKGAVDMVSSGTQFDNHLRYEGKSDKDLDKLYKEFWDNIHNMTIEKLHIDNNKEEGKFEESISFTADNYGVITGERMIFPINAFNVINKAPKRIRNRKLPVEVVRGFYDIDEVEIELPSGYNIEAISNDVLIDNKYGYYTMTIEKISEKKLKFKREFLLKAGNYSKEEYNDYRNFWRQVVKHDKSKIVLIKN